MEFLCRTSGIATIGKNVEEDNFKIDLTEVCCEGMRWVKLTKGLRSIAGFYGAEPKFDCQTVH
jgi:hypothetical protein